MTRRNVFVRHVIAGMDPIKAVVAAGYRESNAPRTLRRLLLREDVSRQLAEAAQEKAQTVADLRVAHRLAVATRDARAALDAIKLRREIMGVGR